jgi:hypothetical protein
MKIFYKIFALLGLIPGLILLVSGGYGLVITLLQQIFSDLYDFRNFSSINLLNSFTSVGGSGTFLDSLIAGKGASGGSAVRYWVYMVYGLISVIGWTICSSCWKVLKNEK